MQADERTVIQHRLYSFSGAEPNGSAQVTIEGLGLNDLKAQYQDGELSVYFLRWNSEAQEMAQANAKVEKEQSKVRFSLSASGIYDLVTVVQLPEIQEQSADDQQDEEQQQPAEIQQDEEQQQPTDDQQGEENQEQSISNNTFSANKSVLSR